MLSKVVRGKFTLGWVILASLGNFTQPEVDANAVFFVNALELRCFLQVGVIHALLGKNWI